MTDRDGAAAVARVSVVVAKTAREAVSGRTPLVRLISSPTSNGAHLDLLTVSAPRGAKHRRPLPRRRLPLQARERTTSKGKTVTLRKLRRSFKAGAIIEIRVTKRVHRQVHADQHPRRPHAHAAWTAA